MSSSIIDFVNCHTEKNLGNNKYINDKFLDVKELNGDTIYQNNVLVATQTDINTLQSQITTTQIDVNTLQNEVDNLDNSNLYNYYVSDSSGNDTTGNGNINNPFKTVAVCMAVVNTLSPETNVIINLSAGTYTEKIVVLKSGVSIVGVNPIAVVLNGDVNFNMVNNSSFYAIGVLSGIQVNGKILHTNNTIYNNTLTISNIISVSIPTENNLSIRTLGGGLLGDCSIRDSIIYVNGDTTGILVNNSALFMIGTQIQNNPSPLIPLTTQNFVYVNGAGRFNCFGCSFYNASNSAIVKALIEIANTSNATSSTTINSSIFLFTNGVATTTGAIINFTNTASANTVNFYNNFCRCFLTQNAPNNYIVLKSGGGAVNFSQGNNLGRTPNHHIPATGAFTGWTKTTFSQVV
jgi:hypothetical protein